MEPTARGARGTGRGGSQVSMALHVAERLGELLRATSTGILVQLALAWAGQGG